MNDKIPDLLRQLVDSDDITEVRQLRKQLNSLIRERIEELRKRASELRDPPPRDDEKS